MKKVVKAFTLVEMLGAIIIVSILLIIAIPSVSKWVKNSKEEAYNGQIETIKTAASHWASANTSLVPNNENGKVSFTIGQLKQMGYLDEKLENPKTKKPFANDIVVTITYVNGGYSYKVGEDTENKFDNTSKESPTIYLFGDLTIFLELNIDEFQEPGYTALDSSGNIISEKVKIDIDKPIDNTVNDTTYTITYTVTDKEYTTVMKRSVVVRDTASPDLEIGDNLELYEDEALKLNLLQGITASDNDTFKPTIEVSGFDNIPGEKTVTYTAIDSSNNKTIKRKTIKVKAIPIDVTFTPLNANFNDLGWAKANFYVKVDIINKSVSKVTNFKWCSTTSDSCTPTSNVNGITSNIYISNENNHNVICIEATNLLGYTLSKCSDPYKLDKTGPTLAGISDIIINRYDTVDLISNVSVTDALSGVNGKYTYNPTSVNTNVAGTTNITYTASDLAGNVTTIIKKVIVDAEAPKITYNVPNVSNSKGWAKTNFNVNISIQDLSGLGLKEVRYCKTTSSSCTPNISGSSNFNVTIDTDSGSNRICTQSTDNNNKTSQIVCSDILKLDKTITTPVITVSSSGITITHSDSISGTENIYYSLSGAVSQTEGKYSSSFKVLTDGTTTITAYAYDNAGNISSKITKNVVISTPACNAATCNYSYNATASSNSYTCYTSCPSGWSASGSQCSQSANYSSGYYYCGSGWSLSGSTCSQTTVQYFSQGGACYCNSTTGAQTSCTDNGCPGGWKIGWSCSGSCRVGISSVSCSNSCAKNVTTTKSASYSSGYYYCNSGSLSGSSCYTSRPTTTCYETVYSCTSSSHTLSGTTCSYTTNSCSSGTYSSTLNKCYS